MNPAKIKAGPWTNEEHERMIEGYRLYGKNIDKVVEHVGTRVKSSVVTRAYQLKITLRKDASLPGADIQPIIDDQFVREKPLSRRKAAVQSSGLKSASELTFGEDEDDDLVQVKSKLKSKSKSKTKSHSMKTRRQQSMALQYIDDDFSLSLGKEIDSKRKKDKTLTRDRWTEEEQDRLIEAIKKNGKNHLENAKHVGTRSYT